MFFLRIPDQRALLASLKKSSCHGHRFHAFHAHFHWRCQISDRPLKRGRRERKSMSTRVFRIQALSLLTVLFAVSLLAGAQTAIPPVAAHPLIPFGHGMTIENLAGHADYEMVELPSGRHLSVGLMRQLSSAMQAARSPRPASHPPAFSIKAGPTGVPVKSSIDIAHAMSTMRETDTVQLPSGHRITVAQLKLLEPLVELRTGHKLSVAPPAPNLSGPSIKIGSGMTKAQWQAILAKPDSTVLESTTGTRVTVGGVKQFMAANPLFPLGEHSASSLGKTPARVQPERNGRPQ
jgi:hypothetical protein